MKTIIIKAEPNSLGCSEQPGKYVGYPWIVPSHSLNKTEKHFEVLVTTTPHLDVSWLIVQGWSPLVHESRAMSHGSSNDQRTCIKFEVSNIFNKLYKQTARLRVCLGFPKKGFVRCDED